jgi:hypothetical protein
MSARTGVGHLIRPSPHPPLASGASLWPSPLGLSSCS